MRLIRDEQAYVRVISDFVEQRVSAAVFMSRFRHLRASDSVLATSGVTRNLAGLHELLESIARLCETFARSLPAGCGYRVSEEQFRKEVQSLAAARPLASPEGS